MEFKKIKNNLYELRNFKNAYLISYESVICEIDIDTDTIFLDYENAFSSATTRKAVYDFLGINKKTILELIDKGRIILSKCNEIYLMNTREIARGTAQNTIKRDDKFDDKYNKHNNDLHKEAIKWKR